MLWFQDLFSHGLERCVRLTLRDHPIRRQNADDLIVHNVDITQLLQAMGQVSAVRSVRELELAVPVSEQRLPLLSQFVRAHGTLKTLAMPALSINDSKVGEFIRSLSGLWTLRTLSIGTMHFNQLRAMRAVVVNTGLRRVDFRAPFSYPETAHHFTQELRVELKRNRARARQEKRALRAFLFANTLFPADTARIIVSHMIPRGVEGVRAGPVDIYRGRVVYKR